MPVLIDPLPLPDDDTHDLFAGALCRPPCSVLINGQAAWLTPADYRTLLSLLAKLHDGVTARRLYLSNVMTT